MTRFFKVSLSVVALLLVSLLVFTGCNGNETADKALSAAENAAKAVTEATADLEAAIANKADSATLAEEVDKLTKAIQNAETIAEDGDASLSKAIAAAKAALTENAQTIVSALDVKIASLLAEKADKAVINAELARFEEVIKNINDATNAYIKVNDFVSFSSTVAIHIYDLEQKFDSMEALKDLYGADWAEIEKAYTVAKAVIYRATSQSVINSALAKFEEAVSKYANPIDALYYSYVLAYQDGKITDGRLVYEKVSDSYRAALSTETAADEKLIADYYGKGNLVLKALELWRKDLEPSVAKLGSIYVVAPENEGYNDADAIVEAAAAVNVFVNGVIDCKGWFSDDVDELSVPASFYDNVSRVEVMKNAKSVADSVIQMGADYALAFPDGAALDQGNVNYINEWKSAYDKWIRDYLPELQAHQKTDADAKARYAAVASLIAPTEEALNAQVNSLKTLATSYISSAEEAFMKDVRDNFYTEGALDLSRVGYFSKPTIDAIKTKANTWAETNDEALVLPAFVYDNAYASKPSVVYTELDTVIDTFNNMAAPVIRFYSTLPHAQVADAVEADKATIYTLEAQFIVDMVNEMGIEWGEETKMVLSDEVTIEKNYLDTLADLAAENKTLVAYKLAKRAELLAAYEALTGDEIYSEIEAAIANVTALLDAYKTGAHADLAEGVTADQLAYDAENWNNVGYLDDETMYDLTVDVAAIESKLEELGDRNELLDEKYQDVADALEALTAAKTGEAWPYLAETTSDEMISRDDYVSLTWNLENAIFAFVTENGVSEAMDEANQAVVEAKALTRTHDIETAANGVREAIAELEALELNAVPSYFDNDDATAVTDKATYQAALDAVANALDAYTIYAEADAELVAAAEAAKDAGLNVLAKDVLIERYTALYNTTKAELENGIADENTLAAAIAELDAYYAKWQSEVHKYTTLSAEEGLNTDAQTDLRNYAAFNTIDIVALKSRYSI